MEALRLAAIDGMDPLGFFAALGVLRILDERPEQIGGSVPKLAWLNEGFWRPTVIGVESVEQILEAVASDLEACRADPVLNFAYLKDSDEPVAPDSPGAICDLKPPISVQRALYDQIASMAAEDRQLRRRSRMLAAFGTEFGVDNSGFAKPTAFHFTAGQQRFLGVAQELMEGLQPEDLVAALTRPWEPKSELKSFSWSGTGQRLYAYRSKNPSGDQKLSCPGAEWLALRGLTFFPCSLRMTTRGPETATTGVRGAWKASHFTWPLWTLPATARTIQSLLRTQNLPSMSAKDRSARGIALVLKADIMRIDQGGYGSFKPAKSI